MLRILSLAAVACGLCTLSTAAPAAAPPPLEPLARWSDMPRDASLRKLAPRDQFIADAQSWEKLWKGWRGAEALPAVDFATELILVGTVDGPNLVLMRPALHEGGDLRFAAAGTRRGGPGFGYLLLKVPRDGVKTVNGVPIEARGVRGTLQLPAGVASFDGHVLEIKLWEYDPRLADASADLVDDYRLEDYGHEEGQLTETPFHVGAKLEPRTDRQYYITLFVTKDGKRTHMGELDGRPGLCKVLTDGRPSKVLMIGRGVR